MPNTPLLDTIHYPADLRKLEKKQLTQLALELREELVDAVSFTAFFFSLALLSPLDGP